MEELEDEPDHEPRGHVPEQHAEADGRREWPTQRRLEEGLPLEAEQASPEGNHQDEPRLSHEGLSLLAPVRNGAGLGVRTRLESASERTKGEVRRETTGAKGPGHTATR